MPADAQRGDDVGGEVRYRPRVLVVGPAPEAHGGVAAMVGAVAGSEILRRRFRLELITTSGTDQGFGKVIHWLRGLSRLAREVARGRVDVVDIHSSTGGSLVRKLSALMIAQSRGVPVVLHLHAGGAAALLDGPPRSIHSRLLRYALRRADCVVALTPGWETRIREAVNTRCVRVVPNVPALAEPVTSRLPGKTIICLGHLYRRKGVHDLLDAFRILRRADQELQLVLAGEGPESSALRQRIDAEEELRESVHLPGWVGATERAELLRRAACLVIPSHSEGLPLTLLEAMASNVPVVATRVGGIPEVVRDEIEALLVAPGDPNALAHAIDRVVHDSELSLRLAAAAAVRATNEYSPEALAERLTSIFEDLAGPHYRSAG